MVPFVRIVASLATLLSLSATAAAEQSNDRAAAFESATLMPLVRNLAPRANWIGDEDRFWIAEQSEDAVRYQIVQAATGAKSDAFDHDALAGALTDAGLEDADAADLPIQSLVFGDDNLTVVTATGVFTCAKDASRCVAAGEPPGLPTTAVAPDGSQEAFVRDYNIWLRDLATGEERQFTGDGVEGFQYGNMNTTLSRVQTRRSGGELPMMYVNWSPDSRYIATLRTDARHIPVRSYIKEHLPPDDTFNVAHMDRAAVAADRLVPKHELAVFDVESGRKTVADLDPEAFQDFTPLFFGAREIWWALERGTLFVTTADVGGGTYRIAAIDIASGKTRVAVEESEEHYYQFIARDYNAPGFYVTSDGRDLIWYSQRTGSGQLYRYDADSGEFRNAISGDEGVVFDLIRVDEAARQVYFTAGGRERGRNPYYVHLYRASFDGGDVELLTPENATHEFYRMALPFGISQPSQSSFSPSGDYFVDVFSTTTQPPRMVIRTSGGELVSEVVAADITALEEHGWQPPEPFVVKAADGKTDLYGAMFKPSDFDPTKKYAVVNQTYPGPQIDSAPRSFLDNFAAITTNNAQATAEAGFIVVALDGRGTTRRDRAFRYAFAGTEDIFGSADHRAAIENLAKQHPYIDASRVGITGESFGGYGSVRAALLHPGFFDVVVSHVGPHEYRNSVASTISVERFFGVPGSDRDYYDLGSNIEIIDRLEADLMLVYGEIDENVPLRAAMEVFDALMEADKDFTSFVVPNANHGWASRNPYIVERQRQFFIEHLGGPVDR